MAQHKGPEKPVDRQSPELGPESRLTTPGVILLFVALTVVMTFPLVLRMDSWILGDFPDNYSDIFAGIWHFWSAKVQLLDLHASPFRFDLTCGPYSQSPIYTSHKSPAVMIPVTALFGPIVSLNVFVMLNFVLAGVFTALVIRQLTGSKTAGIVPGIAFAFCPFAYARATAHPELAPIWTIPFFFYALTLVSQRGTVRSWLALVLSAACVFIYGSPYFYLIIPFALLSWFIAWGCQHFLLDFSTGKLVKGAFRRISRRKWLITISIAVALTAVLAVVYVVYLRPAAVAGARPLHWQQRFSLNLLNYLLPSAQNPLWGSAVSRIQDKLIDLGLIQEQRNIIESAVFFGWLPLLLAILGFSTARRDWRAVAVMIFGLIAMSITFGPYFNLWGARIPLPSALLHEFAPFIRAIGRYSVFVMFTVAVLAGFGIQKILTRQGMNNRKALAVISILALITCLEFAFPKAMMKVPAKISDAPPVYEHVLELEPDATIFEYPPVTMLGMPMADYFFYQTLHHKRLFNRYFDVTNIPAEYFPFWQDMDYPGALSDPENIRMLKYFGVDYVVYHLREGSQWVHWNEPDLSLLRELELVEDLGNDKIYRIIAPPAKAMLRFDTILFYNYSENRRRMRTEGFTPSMVPASGVSSDIGWRVLLERGKLQIVNLTDSEQTFRLHAVALTTVPSRRIQARLNGREVAVFELNYQRRQPVSIPEIKIAPHATVEIELVSLDGTSPLNLKVGKFNASAIFGSFDLKTDEK